MTTDEFRMTLRRLGLSQRQLAHLLAHLGDDATPMTILRRVERWAQGGTRVPGEMAALMNVLETFPAVRSSILEAMVDAGRPFE